jgi:hypothetical protein
MRFLQVLAGVLSVAFATSAHALILTPTSVDSLTVNGAIYSITSCNYYITPNSGSGSVGANTAATSSIACASAPVSMGLELVANGTNTGVTVRRTGGVGTIVSATGGADADLNLSLLIRAVNGGAVLNSVTGTIVASGAIYADNFSVTTSTVINPAKK